MNNKQIDDLILKTINDNKLNKVNSIYLSNKQIQILNSYDIDYKNVLDIKELIFKIESYINDNYQLIDTSELEYLSEELSEYNYYYNTNK